MSSQGWLPLNAKLQRIDGRFGGAIEVGDVGLPDILNRVCQFGVKGFAATEHQLDRPAVIDEWMVGQRTEKARYAIQNAEVMTYHQIGEGGAAGGVDQVGGKTVRKCSGVALGFCGRRVLL